MNKRLIGMGSILAFLSVAFGAFGAHALKGVITADMLAVYQTGVQYHMFHALGLIAAGSLAGRLGKKAVTAGWLLFAGVVLFSGSLYLLALTSIGWLGAITPLGGVSFLAGWMVLAVAAYKSEVTTRKEP
ncbi:DUF423 domain-containing protein [Paenibacillus thalictri]|uniref:DUF423 domain-containing protein n=1 Tax=Paenibacillus thalictri TaxID=2527873 RepID=A0A4Q9DK83_9BACL|nr:DUF423 domain-containing protein [Paenibacillus thalictri]TBL75136.1 DUF423 domain-containing protein [Paenibacillus thalictri]